MLPTWGMPVDWGAVADANGIGHGGDPVYSSTAPVAGFRLPSRWEGLWQVA